jgi:hypothetical protein
MKTSTEDDPEYKAWIVEDIGTADHGIEVETVFWMIQNTER